MTDSKKMVVLVLEDSPQDVFLLRAGLSKISAAQFEILHVERLSDALGLLERVSVDLILTDLNLPDSLGVDTVRALTAKAPGVPVVVLFGCNSPDMEKPLAQAGAWACISKDGLNSPALSGAVTAAIQHKHP